MYIFLNTNAHKTNTQEIKMADQYEMEQQTSQGIRLTTRSDTSITQRDKTRPHKIRDNIIQEEPWNLTKMLERYSFIESRPWLSTQPSHTVLSKLRVPQDLIVNGLTSAPFENFLYWNGTVKVKFQVIGSPLTQGCCMAFFVPLTDDTFIESNILPNFSSATCNQTIYMFANANTAAEMNIAFNSPQAYLNLQQSSTISVNNTLGYIYIVVMNQLALSTGTPDNVAISVFSQFKDNEFKVPRRTAVTKALRLTTQSSSRVLNGFMKALEPENVIGDAIDLATAIFGMDNPIDPGIDKTNKVITTQRMNFGEGVEYIDKLCIEPSKVSEVTSDTFATELDEMDFDVIKKKYTYLGSFNMSTARVSGDILASFPMNPCPNNISLLNPNQVPLIQYLSIPYCFWKGSLTYKIQVVSTSMQTAKLFISLNYGEFEPSASGMLVSTSSQYGEAFEINQGSNTYEFTVPYVAITPELYVSTSNIPTGADSLGMINVSVLNNLVSPNNSPTTISFNVFIAGGDDFSVNALSMGNNLLPLRRNVEQPIRQIRQKIVQEVEYDSDIEIVNIPAMRKVLRKRVQSAAQPLITPMSNINMSEDSLVAPPTNQQERQDVAQQRVTDIRKLMKKYHLYKHNTFDMMDVAGKNGKVVAMSLVDLFGFSAQPPIPFGAQVSQIPALWAHYQSLFRQFKGSLNFKIMFDSGENIFSSFSVFYQPPLENRSQPVGFGNQVFTPIPRPTFEVNNITSTTWQSNSFGTRLPITYSNGINRTAEFSIPYSSRYLSIINSQSPEDALFFDYADLGTLFLYFDYTPPAIDTEQQRIVSYNIFFSFGDDARFGTLFNVPYLLYNPYVNPTDGIVIGSAWPDEYASPPLIFNTLVIL